MNRSNLGDTSATSSISISSSEDNTSEDERFVRIQNPYEQPTTSAQAARARNEHSRANNITPRIVPTARNSTSRVDSTTTRSRRKPQKTFRGREMKVLKEILKFQKSTELLIPRAPFGRLVREITLGLNSEVNRYTLSALQALQESTEMFLTQFLHDSYLLTLHRQRVTLSKQDMVLLSALKCSLGL